MSFTKKLALFCAILSLAGNSVNANAQGSGASLLAMRRMAATTKQTFSKNQLIPQVKKAPTTAKTYDVPFLESFRQKESLNDWTIIDANNDGATWKWESVYASLVSAGFSTNDNPADDWLISPQLNLQKDVTYILDFKPSVTWFGPITIQAFIGQGADVSAMKALTDTINNNDYDPHYKAEFTVSADGLYNIGFHDTSAKGNYMFLDSVSVSTKINQEAPDSVTSFKVTADEKGNNAATVSFNAPTKAINGSLLTSLTKIEVRRANEIIHTFNNPTPGEALSYTDEGASTGRNSYTVIPYNEAGFGTQQSSTLFIGVDVPLAPDSLSATDIDPMNIRLAWTPVENHGEWGYFVNPDSVEYNIYNASLNERGYVQLGTKLATSKKGATDFIVMNTNDRGDQYYKVYAIKPQNRAGEGGYIATNILVGAPYTLPFRESFDSTRTTYRAWTYSATEDQSLGLTTESADEGNGGFGFIATKANQNGWFQSGKITLKGSANAKLGFRYRSKAGSKITITPQIVKIDGTVVSLSPINVETLTDSLWHQAKYSLGAYASERYIRLRFLVAEETANVETDIDRITVSNLAGNDLAVDVAAPESVIKGKSDKAVVSVSNLGDNDASNYTVKLYAGNEIVGDTLVASTLPSLEDTAFTFNFKTTNVDGSATTLPLRAEVAFAADDKTDNNTATKNVSLTDGDAPSVSNLTATKSEDVVNVKWNAPVPSNNEFTETFEDYDYLSTSFGGWTTANGNGGLSLINFAPNADAITYDAGFTVFNPQKYSSQFLQIYPEFAAHGGSQYAASPYQEDKNGTKLINSDVWLISPQLSGYAQTVKFYVRNLNYINVDEEGNIIKYQYPERFIVLSSSTDNNTNSFKAVTDTLVTRDMAWEEVSVDLPAGTNYFAIHQVTEADSAFMLAVDDATFFIGSHNPVSYNVYSDGVLVGNTTEAAFVDRSKNPGSVYTVTAVYADGSESQPQSATVVATGINEINADKATKPYDIYDLQGRRMPNGRKLPAGVYIQNGKKIIVK